MATTDQLQKAARRALNPMPPVNSFKRDGWIKVIRAMDMARFGKPTEIITWRLTRASLHACVAKRIAEGEPFPPRSTWGAN